MTRRKKQPRKYRYLLTIGNKTDKTEQFEALYDEMDIDLLVLILATIRNAHKEGEGAIFSTENGVLVIPTGVWYHVEIGSI